MTSFSSVRPGHRAPRALAVLVVVLAVTMVALAGRAATEARADHTAGHCDTYAWHPSDPSYACEWWNDHLRWCDRQVDGHRVRAWYQGQWASEPTYTAWAPSGGCYEIGTNYGSGLIVKYRVCVEAEGCSAWRKPY